MRLTVDNLQLIRNERQLFKGLSFELSGGEALLLTGANGSGKSSLLRALLGLLATQQGSITLEGAEGTIAENAHFLGTNDGLKPALTAGENLNFWAAALGGTSSPAYALAKLNLAKLEHTPVAYLSAGQRRRVALSRLAIAHRRVWLLDEPTNALDLATQSLLAALCQAHLETGGLIIAATHVEMSLPNAKSIEPGASQ